MEVEMSGESAAAALRRELAARRPWGTWEELVLGGAVLRHGTADWSSVAEELRFRFSYPFTSQECEAKYEDAKERFSGFGAWLDELRRQRVDELRRELEQSEDSIGSLQLKLETLKAEKEGDQSRDSGNTDSPFPTENAEGADLSSKEPSHDRSSAGSFVEETRCAWSPEPQIAESVSAQNFNMEGTRDFTWHVFGMSGNAVAVPVNLRKKRGARKRRFRIDANEGSAGPSDSVYSHDGNAEESKGFSIQNTGPSNRGPNPSSEDYSQHSVGNHENLEGVLRELMKHESASLFHHRLESQKKARYRKMIRRHVDFQIIKSRIDDGAISSAKEVLRDLLLLSNNALVFYPKQSREHKSAFTLRHLVSQWLRKDRQAIQTPDVAASGESKVVKPEAGEPSCADKATGSGLKPERASIAKRAGNSRKASDACAAPTALLKKRKPGRPAKNSIHLGPKQSSVKGRKHLTTATGDFVDVLSWLAMLKKSLLWDKIQFQTSLMPRRKVLPCMIIFGLLMFLVVYHVTSLQYQQTQAEKALYPFDSAMDPVLPSKTLDNLPRGIVQARSDMEMKPLWTTRGSGMKDDTESNRNLLAIPAGIKQRKNVDAIVRKKISLPFFSTMMGMLTTGKTYSGAIKQFMLLLTNKQNGGLLNVSYTPMLFQFMIISFFGMKI